MLYFFLSYCRRRWVCVLRNNVEKYARCISGLSYFFYCGVRSSARCQRNEKIFIVGLPVYSMTACPGRSLTILYVSYTFILLFQSYQLTMLFLFLVCHIQIHTTAFPLQRMLLIHRYTPVTMKFYLFDYSMNGQNKRYTLRSEVMHSIIPMRQFIRTIDC